MNVQNVPTVFLALEQGYQGYHISVVTLVILINRSSIESNIFEKLNEIEEFISKFYEVEKMEFLGPNESVLRRDVVFFQETSNFILNIIEQRKMDPFSTLVRISLDSEGSFLKVIVNIFDPEDNNVNSGRFLNSGVQ
ncbi:uncharacterized protein LOC136088975 [Hydra vulgaris]|uniref:Uncharacterized protein LOC136088975 n=1 Tax=Hydra vulgaris TaxID=6087 RepID=A0ABM4D7R5_HYDVU